MANDSTPGILGCDYEKQELDELADLGEIPAGRIPELSAPLKRAARLHVPLIQAALQSKSAKQRKALVRLAKLSTNLVVGVGELDSGARHELLLEYGGFFEFEARAQTRVIGGKCRYFRKPLKWAQEPHRRLSSDVAHLGRLSASLQRAAAALAKRRGRKSNEHIDRFVEALVAVYVAFTGKRFIASRKRGRNSGYFVTRAVQIACPGVQEKTIATAMTRAVRTWNALDDGP